MKPYSNCMFGDEASIGMSKLNSGISQFLNMMSHIYTISPQLEPKENPFSEHDSL